jgi:hypothetical protein
MKSKQTLLSILVAASLGSGSLFAVEALVVDGTGNVGVGTETPADKMHVLDGNLRVQQTAEASKIIFIAGANSWEIKQNKNTGRLTFFSPGGGATTAAFKFDRQSVENLLQVGINAADEVTVNGDLVVTGGCCAPDYVFSPDYNLLSLGEVDTFIQENGHLPNVPNAEAFEGQGINMREMSYTLLEKVEELTLYTIEQQKTIESLQAEIENLKAR